MGKTEAGGIFKGSLLPGKYELKVISKGFEDQVINMELTAKGKNSMDVFVLEPQPEVASSTSTVTTTAGSASNSVLVDNFKKTRKEEQPKPKRETKKEDTAKKPAKQELSPEQENSSVDEQQVVVCMYCGYVNTVPKGKRLRFCVNCAKPLK